jgi:hypothetical protein
VPSSQRTPAQAEGRRARSPDDTAHNLARELTGDLPCINCGYNLRSISVLSVCPECGTPVRATLLARVDPYAGVLRPIKCPRLIAGGLLLWSIAALAAAALTWVLRLADAVAILTPITIPTGHFVILATAFILLSALGAAVALIRPHSSIPRSQMLLAAAAVLAYLPLAWTYWQLHAIYDPPRIRPYLDAFSPDSMRAMLRLASGILMIVIALALRPAIRVLTARSLLLRMGRVDRQTTFALAAAIGVAAAGDVLHIVFSESSPTLAQGAFLLGVVLIALGSMLVTVGLVGIVVDCLRIAPVILRPPISYRQVLGTHSHSAGQSGGGDR